VIPFALGIGLAYYVYNQFAPEEILSFSLFMGIALSITAFPVLARIVQERGIHKTKLGAIVITCAAADDITVYSGSGNCHCKSGDILSSLYIIMLAMLYVAAMIYIVNHF
jgi:Kef-type K+ transport system membrane component KefB